MKYIDYLKQVIKAIAYDNVILFPMDKVINKQIEVIPIMLIIPVILCVIETNDEICHL